MVVKVKERCLPFPLAHKGADLGPLFRVERHDRFENGVQRERVDKGGVVDVDKDSHHKLAVDPVDDAAVTRQEVAKVLNFESALNPGGEKAPKGSDQRGKDRKDHGVETERDDGDGGCGQANLGENVTGPARELERLRGKRGAGRAGGDLKADLVHWADQTLVLGQDSGHRKAENHRKHRAAQESLPGLLRAQLDQRRAPNKEPDNVSRCASDSVKRTWCLLDNRWVWRRRARRKM